MIINKNIEEEAKEILNEKEKKKKKERQKKIKEQMWELEAS